MSDLIFVDLKKNDYMLDSNVFIDKKVIALSSNSMWCLKKNNIKYNLPYDYFNYKDLDNVNENDYKVARTIVDFVKKKLVKTDHLSSATSSDFLLHPVKILLSNINHRRLNILSVIKNEKPESIIYFTDKRKIVNDTLYQNPDNNGYYEKIIVIISSDMKIQLEVVQQKSHWVESRRSWISTLKIKVFIKDLIELVLLNIKKSFQFKKKHTHAIFIGQNSQSVNYFYRNILKSGQYRVFLSNYRLSLHYIFFNLFNYSSNKKLMRLIKGLLQEKEFIKLTKLDNRLFNDILKGALFDIIIKGYRIYQSSFKQINRVVKKNDISLFLSSTVTQIEIWGQRDAFKINHIPIITWQHGSYCMVRNFSQPIYYDLQPADFFFAFGKGVKKYFSSKGINKAKIINTGSPHLDGLLQVKSYSNSGNGIQKFVFPLRGMDIPTYTDSYQKYPQELYWNELEQVIDALSKVDDCLFILKPFPLQSGNGDIVGDYIKYKQFRNIKISSEKSFAELLTECNGCILDWPYTTLLECLATGVHTIIYRKNWDFNDGIKDLLTHNCITVNDVNELKTAIKNVKKGEISGSDVLLKDYGVHKFDGNSVKRAKTEINKVIKNYKYAI